MRETSRIGSYPVEQVTMNVGIIQLVHRLNAHEQISAEAERNMYDQILLRIRRFIIEDHQKDIVIKYPKGWWQTLKQDWLTGIANYFPVKMTEKVVSAKMYYPDIAIPSEQAFVKFVKYEGVKV